MYSDKTIGKYILVGLAILKLDPKELKDFPDIESIVQEMFLALLKYDGSIHKESVEGLLNLLPHFEKLFPNLTQSLEGENDE